MWKWVTIGIFVLHIDGLAQTCCSGGVPISNNIGFPAASRGSLQLLLSHDLNTLNTLLNGAQVLEDGLRSRKTHSLLFSVGYTLTQRFSMDLSVSYVWQRREITPQDLPPDLQQTNGVGDIMMLAKYQLTDPQNPVWNVVGGIGTKLSNGNTTERSENGIIYNLDLQPGSGATDGILWLSSSYSLGFRPSMSLNGQFIARLTGVYRNYLGSESFEIGDNYRLHLGLSDQIILGKSIFNSTLNFKFRKAFFDRVNGQKLVNTGGQWLFLSPEIKWVATKNITLVMQLEIPLYANVNGEQLSTTYRSTSSVYYLKQRESFFDEF